MNCDTIDDLLLDLLYEEVEGDTKIQAEGHLSGCESCQQKFTAMGGVRRSFLALPEPEMPMLGYQALLAEAASAAKRYAQPEVKKEEEREGLWAKLRAGMKLLLSPPVAVAAGLALVLTLSLSINEKAPSNGAPAQMDSQMAPTAFEPPPQATAPILAVKPTEAATAEPELELAHDAPLPEKKPTPTKTGKMALPEAPLADKKSNSDAANDFDGFAEGAGFGATATPGVASAAPFSAQSIALAKEGKCGEAEKTARAISAGSTDWCQGIQASAECFQQNQKLTETRTLYTEMQSFTNCAADAERGLASLNKSQVGGPNQGTKSTIRAESKKKMKPSPSPKSIDPDSTLSPFQKEKVSF